ncbi:50S ribosomal protein L2 [candidate division WOR-3 bacterium]|nr:50S ribosomal protein L2 [candidate division WOR-3 bacterium]
MLKKTKPTTPSRRHMSFEDFSSLSKVRPLKALTRPLKSKAGRDSKGRITVRHRGGGAKRVLRLIDFKREKHGVEAKVTHIEYDPNRGARIARLSYLDGEKRYIICPWGLSIGDRVVSGADAPIKIGNALPLRKIPPGMDIHNIEFEPGRGGKLIRAAGTSAKILAKEGKYAHVVLSSGEIRLIHIDCFATLGQVSNPDHRAVVIGKAGRMRHMGRRPKVRGVAMNPVDHPMGGGEGRSKGHIPRSPTGVPAKGKKTRKRKKPSNKFIIKRRKK